MCLEIERLRIFWYIGNCSLSMWKDHDSCRYYASIESVPPSCRTLNTSYKIAMFDLDGTLIATSNGKRYADSDPTTWVYLGPIPERLQQLRLDDWIVAIITNQGRFNSNVGNRIEHLRLDLQTQNGWSPFIFIATDYDVFRKPQAGMLSLLLALLQSPPRAIQRIFMCGDGVGPLDPYLPYRWSSIDSDLALSMGIVFYRPIDIFGSNFDKIQPPQDQHLELVILVGNAGSGKSTTANRLSNQGYVSCNQDTLKIKSGVNQCVIQNLQAGRSVVIDSTNPSREKRLTYLRIASEYRIPARILWHVRDGRSWNSTRAHSIPEVAYGVYSKYFERPTSDEAPVEIIY